jgi:hypothetical protein
MRLLWLTGLVSGMAHILCAADGRRASANGRLPRFVPLSYIVGQLKADVTVSTISARLIAEKGLTASRSSLRRWIVANLSELTARSRASVPRGLVPPGSEAQIDYGKLGSWVDPATGTRHTIWAFVMVLACSRMMFVRPVIRLDQTSWCESHVEAFRFFGGAPARLVPDNLKTGVDRPDLYDPRINRVLRRTRRALLRDPGPGQSVQTEGQTSGRAGDALDRTCVGLGGGKCL